MTLAPEAGMGEESQLEAPGLWARTRRQLGRKLSYALGDQIVYSFGNMVVAALLARHAAAREFGMYILTQRALDVLQQLCNVFLWGPFAFNLPAAKGREKQYIGSVFLHQLFGCAAGVVLLYVASAWAATPARGLYYGVFHPLIWTSIGIVFREYTRRMYFGEMRMREAFWTDVATVVLQIAGVEALYLTHRLTVHNTLWMLSGGAILVSFWWLVQEWNTFVIRWRDSLADLKLNSRLGKWFLGSNMVFMVSSQCNPWVLSWAMGPLGAASVGDLNKCESVVNIARVALVSLQNIMAPMMARAYAEGGKAALKKMVRRMDAALFGGSALFAQAIFWFGPWVATLIFKQVPGNARLILIVLSINLVAYASTMAQSYGLSVMGRADSTFYAQAAGLAVQLSVCLWLIHRLQVPGAAAAMLLGSIVVLIVRQIVYMREMRTA